MSAFDELAERLREMGHGVALEASPPVERWEVKRQSPLLIEQVGGDEDLLLEEGDPDVEIVRDVLARRPAVGDLMLVHQDDTGWIVSGVIGPSTSPGGGSGPGSGDEPFVHEQAVPSAVWTIHHNLGRPVIVWVVDSAGTRVLTGERHIDLNTAEVTFGGPTTGTAYAR